MKMKRVRQKNLLLEGMVNNKPACDKRTACDHKKIININT